MLAFKKVMVATLALGVLAPAFAFAQTTSTTSASLLVGQIQSLQTQINVLQQQQQQAMATLVTTLRQGSTGDQVLILQALLAADPSIYPEGIVSGFFGRLTADAVKRFQKKNGIEQVGLVGPKTLKKLQEFLREHPLAFSVASSTATSTQGRSHEDKRGKSEDRRPCAIIPPGHLVAPGWLKKHKGENNQIVPECQKLPKGIKDLLDDDDDDDNDNDDDDDRNPPVADITVPVISAISVSNVAATVATVGWTTNEGATSQVAYGLTSSYTNTTALNTALVTTHQVVLSGLTASTVYHFRIDSKDASGNLATSSDITFTTSATPDTTAPVISGINVSPVASTTATIAWTTSENATGKVYYGTVSPVNFLTALTMSSAALTTGHSFGLTGLATSTMYFYALESKDASLNTSTTSTQSFVTTAI